MSISYGFLQLFVQMLKFSSVLKKTREAIFIRKHTPLLYSDHGMDLPCIYRASVKLLNWRLVCVKLRKHLVNWLFELTMEEVYQRGMKTPGQLNIDPWARKLPICNILLTWHKPILSLLNWSFNVNSTKSLWSPGNMHGQHSIPNDVQPGYKGQFLESTIFYRKQMIVGQRKPHFIVKYILISGVRGPSCVCIIPSR